MLRMCEFCRNKGDYPTYKYALVDVRSKKPHSLYADRKAAEEERCDLRKCYGAVLIVVDLSEVEE